MTALKPYILIVVVLALVGAIYFINSNSVKRGGSNETVTVAPRASSEETQMDKEEKSKQYKLAKEITTPYLNAWYEKYKDKGLVIIGVHTPEFEFEKNYDNVKTAVEKFGIKFPVV